MLGVWNSGRRPPRSPHLGAPACKPLPPLPPVACLWFSPGPALGHGVGGRSLGALRVQRGHRSELPPLASGPRAASAATATALSRHRPRRPPPRARPLAPPRPEPPPGPRRRRRPPMRFVFPSLPVSAFVCPPRSAPPPGARAFRLCETATPSAPEAGIGSELEGPPACIPRGGDQFKLRRLGSRNKWRSRGGPCGSKGEPGCTWFVSLPQFPRLALAGKGPAVPVPARARWALQPDKPHWATPPTVSSQLPRARRVAEEDVSGGWAHGPATPGRQEGPCCPHV